MKSLFKIAKIDNGYVVICECGIDSMRYFDKFSEAIKWISENYGDWNV